MLKAIPEAFQMEVGSFGSFRTKRNLPLGMWFHTISPPPIHTRTHPWTINISTPQSIFIIKHMPIAVCGCEDTRLLFIHLIYLYFFPEGETLVSIHLCWLPAITEHLEPPLNWPEGSTILERSACFRAKRCDCCVWGSNRVSTSVITNTKYMELKTKNSPVVLNCKVLDWCMRITIGAGEKRKYYRWSPVSVTEPCVWCTAVCIIETGFYIAGNLSVKQWFYPDLILK